MNDWLDDVVRCERKVLIVATDAYTDASGRLSGARCRVDTHRSLSFLGTFLAKLVPTAD